MRPGHADHVELALADRVAGGGDVVDLAAWSTGKAGRRRAPRRRSRGAVPTRMPWIGITSVEGRVGVDVAADDVEEVDRPGPPRARRDLEPVVARRGRGPVLVDDHADADDEVGADAARARPCSTAPTKRRRFSSEPPYSSVAVVGGRRPELVEEMAVGLDLDPVDAAPPASRCAAAAYSPTIALDVPVLGLLGEGAMRRLAHRRRGDSTGSQSAWFQPVRRPRWVSWIMHARAVLVAPRRSCGAARARSRRGRRAGCRTPAGCPRATTAEPAVIVSAMPPLAFSTW